MRILSFKEYNFRWTLIAPNGFGQSACQPCYHEYLQREIYKQDFLDLYIGVATFKRKFIEGCFYVQITGNQILENLGIPYHPTLIKIDKEIEYLLLDYDYPWVAELENANSRCIKYIMIGEASPPQNPKILGLGMSDKNNSFFYNILHLKSTNYFSEPCITFNAGNNPLSSVNNKQKSLIELANKGVILIDLYPFAISFKSNFRKRLSVNMFYDDLIENLTTNIVWMCPPNKLKIALVGPTITTTKIINLSIVNKGLNFGNYTVFLDELTNDGIIDNLKIWTNERYHQPIISLPPIQNYHRLKPFFLAPYPILLPTFGHNISPREQLTIMHSYRLIAVPKGMTGPNRIALAYAFNL